MNYTPFIFPNICEWAPAPQVAPFAPTKPQNTPYTLPPFLPPQRVVCDPTGQYGCAIEAPSLDNSELLNDGWPAMTLPQIWSRGNPGPWQRIGYVVSSHEEPKDKTMALFARKTNFRNNRYDYRVTDTNGVAIDIAQNVRWLDSGEHVHVDGRSHPYTVKVYSEFN
jgi:hypothetical protein